jgi:hypothetical protein
LIAPFHEILGGGREHPGGVVGKLGEYPFGCNSAFHVEPAALADLEKAGLHQPMETALRSAAADVKYGCSFPNAKGDFAIVRVWASVTPRYLDVERSAVSVERLPGDRGEHVFLQRDISAFVACAFVIRAAIGQ